MLLGYIREGGREGRRRREEERVWREGREMDGRGGLERSEGNLGISG